MRILEVHHLLFLIVNDAHRADLPLRRLARIVFARFASGIDAVMEYREVAGGALGADGRHARAVRRFKAQGIDETVAVIVRQVDDLAVRDLAVRFGQPDIAFRMQALGGLVVDDAVGLDLGPAIIHLHIADGGDAMVGVVVVDLLRAHEHLLLPGFICRDGDLGLFRRRQRRIGDLLGEGRRKRERAAKSQ